MGGWTRLGRATLIAGIGVSVAAACQGEWRTANPSPVRTAHVALLHTGKVLLVAGSGNSQGDFNAGTFKTSLWDPNTDTYQSVATPWDAFCSGHAFLPDGKLLVAGGNTAFPGPATNNANAGSNRAYVFNPATSTYQARPNMAVARWYPTVVELGSGNLLTVAGLGADGLRTNTSQIFDGTTWSADKAPPAALNFMPMYPALHLLKDGRLFYSGSNTFGNGPAAPGIWNFTTNAWQPVPGLTSPNRRDQSMSVLLPPAQNQKVLIMGGGHQDQPVDAVASTAIADLNSLMPAYGPGPSMDAGKMYVSAVILPDSTVFQTGGASTTIHNGNRPVFSSQIYDPKTNTWTKTADSTIPRTYHSSALLLPDGRVATFGGNPEDHFEMRVEIYKPPYLQKNTPRPTISGGGTEIRLGGTYAVGTTQASPIKSAVLVRPGAVTHSSDSNQRLVDLPFTRTATGISFNVTANQNIAPPGWYMLFVVDNTGVPSVAKWVHLSN